MVGSIDPRCETVRGTHWPKKVAWLFGARVAETILASGSKRPHQQAGHMDASDPIRPEKTLAARGPSTYGSRFRGDDSLRGCCALRRCLVPREFGLVELEFLRDRSGNAGTRAQPLVIGFHGGPFRQLDRRRRDGPVDDGDEVSAGDAEMVEQEFAAFEILLE